MLNRFSLPILLGLERDIFTVSDLHFALLDPNIIEPFGFQFFCVLCLNCFMSSDTFISDYLRLGCEVDVV